MSLKKKIKKVLIANRGEIAIRIMRTCKDMGINTVAVYSDVDKNSPHLQYADEVYNLGPAPATDSYLKQEKVIEVAKDTCVDAIHPGYGFLSENPDFARKIKEEGMVFIGPSPQSMRLMGNKTNARQLATSIGIPIIPGTDKPVQDLEEAKTVSKKLNFPVLIKAAGGGGGKGMRIVNSEGELPRAYQHARSEASSAFSDDRVYIEKYLQNPRHIEIQALSDMHGNIVHLGERECSIQRRHQKIIEESPSIIVDTKLRHDLTKAAIELIRHSGYVNAGTVEFLLDSSGSYYFLEMNTRLQVEHPVTEMRTGIDIVREQILIAQGEKIRYSQEEIHFRGFSIECRIYAEDPLNNFFPSTGTIEHLRIPQGPFIRVDSGIDAGSIISPYYDPLLYKLISWGTTRTEAIERLSRALIEIEMFGVKNNIKLCLWIINHPKFQEGNFNTHFLSQNNYMNDLELVPENVAEFAALIAVVGKNGSRQTLINKHDKSTSLWKSRRLDEPI